MSATVATATTARLTPELFPDLLARSLSRALVITALAVVLLGGFAFRAYHLSAESLSEDELNKVRAVEEYRAKGLTPANGEHPFLMKAMLAVSVVVMEGWNETGFVRSRPELRVSTETAVRLPGAILGALTGLLIFLVTAELFGPGIGLIAAALWAFDPSAIGFNRIAKEDSFLLFFFLLANVFWLRGQRVAEDGSRNPVPYYWATAAAFGAVMASKYLPHYLAISVSYYYIFQGVKATRWRMGKQKWLIFFAVMGATFIICNPTILLPGTWHEMRVFAGEKRIGHDSYEFMGQLYRNQMTLWLEGSPWYFYYAFMGVKLPLLTLLAFVAGLPLLFMKRLGDGRYFILFWLFFWFFPFTFLGGKFTRYFTFALAPVLMTSAIGIHAAAQLLSRLVKRAFSGDLPIFYARAALALIVITASSYASALAAPHYRLYTNALGGGQARAGTYFPHDEFYDSYVRDVASTVARHAAPGVRVASETPKLLNYYVRNSGRHDLGFVSLSDKKALREFTQGDIVVLMRGRRYFSNDAIWKVLRAHDAVAHVSLGEVPASSVYVLEGATLEAFSGTVNN